MATVSSVMTANPASCTAQTPLRDVARNQSIFSTGSTISMVPTMRGAMFAGA